MNEDRPKLVQVKALPGYRLFLQYDDGVEGVADLSDKVGTGVFAPLADEQIFSQVAVGPEGGVVWGDEIDLCPDALYLQVTGKSPEHLFPKLRELQRAHA